MNVRKLELSGFRTLSTSLDRTYFFHIKLNGLGYFWVCLKTGCPSVWISDKSSFRTPTVFFSGNWRVVRRSLRGEHDPSGGLPPQPRPWRLRWRTSMQQPTFKQNSSRTSVPWSILEPGKGWVWVCSRLLTQVERRWDWFWFIYWFKGLYSECLKSGLVWISDNWFSSGYQTLRI